MESYSGVAGYQTVNMFDDLFRQNGIAWRTDRQQHSASIARYKPTGGIFPHILRNLYGRYVNHWQLSSARTLYSNRFLNTVSWYKLDSDIVCSSSLNIFKNNLERVHKDESFIGLFRSAWLRKPSQSPGEASSGKLSGKLYSLNAENERKEIPS